MRETWYVLQDGSVADPRDVAPDDVGVLRHKGGVAVAMKGEVPHSRGVNVDAERAKAVTTGKMSPNDARAASGLAPVPSREAPVVADRELTAERPAERVKRPYKTRESKTR